MDSLSGLLAFVHAAETGSFVAASEKLAVSASAISKSVARLESELGVRLFNRNTRRLSLTEEGTLFFERARRIVGELEAAESELSRMSDIPRGKLRVSVPAIGYRMLMPFLPEFVARYPEVELDLDFNDRLIDVIAEGMDAVIRSGDVANSQLRSRPLGRFGFVVAGAPAYLAKHGTPKKLGNLHKHVCLRYKFPTTGLLQDWNFDANRPEAKGLNVPVSHTFNSVEALIAATSAGLGLAYLPSFAVRDALAGGTIRAVLADCIVEGGVFSILWPQNRHMMPKLRVFVDFLVEQRVLGD